MKMLHIFRMDRDISNILKDLNSVYHEEQPIEVLQKSVIFSFFVVTGLTLIHRETKSSLIFAKLLQLVPCGRLSSELFTNF